MSEFIENRFNSVPVGEAKMWLANTQMLMIGSGRANHVRYTSGEEVKRFRLTEPLFEKMMAEGYTAETYPDWETFAHWEDIETANERELSSPEYLKEIPKEKGTTHITLNHFNTRLRMFADVPEATHVEYFLGGKCLAFTPTEEELKFLFDNEFPAVYMSTIELDEDSMKWLAKRAA